jgi:hypothetical protein
MAEAGVADFVMDGGWFACLRRRNCLDIAARLHREVTTALTAPGAEDPANARAEPSARAEFKAFLAERSRLCRARQDAKIEPHGIIW